MEQAKWKIKIKPNGQIEIEGSDFQGQQCINDVIYKLIQDNAIIERETKHAAFADETPVENLHYVEES